MTKQNQFYQSLNNVIRKAPKKDMMIIQGGCNAKIGPDAHENWKGTVGKYGMGDTNERGRRLLEIARMNNKMIANMLYPHKTSRRYNWASPDDITHNQIDIILVQKRFISGVVANRTKAFLGADIGRDHNLVMMSIKIRLRRIQKKSSGWIKYKLEKPRDPSKNESSR